MGKSGATSFQDQNIIVTGGASGIGLAAAVALEARGARVALLDVNAAALEQSRERFRQPERVVTRTLDVAQAEAVEAAVKSVEGEMGPVDILLASAGVMEAGPFLELTPDEIDRLVSINVTGTANAIRAVLPSMRERRQGCIITVASVLGLHAFREFAVYAATKFAVINLTESLASENLDYGIKFHVLCPPGTDTTLVAGLKHRPKSMEKFGLAPVDAVVTGLLEGIDKEEFLILVTPETRALHQLQRFAPPLFDRFVKWVS